MQHEVYFNPGARTRASRPYLAVLQADVVEGPSKLVCPLFRPEFIPPSRISPLVRVLDDDFFLGIEEVFSLPKRLLKRPIASIAPYRDDIVRALDWLFTGL